MQPDCEKLLTPLLDSVGGMSGTETLKMMIREGLVDRRAAEALYARSEVERMIRRGTGRCRAMEYVAEELCCSYEKVRAMIYASRR